MIRHTSHVTRHTSHVTRHTSHVTRHTSHVNVTPCSVWAIDLDSSRLIHSVEKLSAQLEPGDTRSSLLRKMKRSGSRDGVGGGGGSSSRGDAAAKLRRAMQLRQQGMSDIISFLIASSSSSSSAAAGAAPASAASAGASGAARMLSATPLGSLVLGTGAPNPQPFANYHRAPALFLTVVQACLPRPASCPPASG
jgi:hypothetical protein